MIKSHYFGLGSQSTLAVDVEEEQRMGKAAVPLERGGDWEEQGQGGLKDAVQELGVN